MWQCTDEPCLATCTVYGDGHYLTFDGQRYSFNGDCEYTLVQDDCGGNGSAQDTFHIVTENVPCGTTGTTCSKAIKIFLGVSEGPGHPWEAPGSPRKASFSPVSRDGHRVASRSSWEVAWGPCRALSDPSLCRATS